MGTLGAVSVLISNVGDGVDHAIGSGVRVRSLHYLVSRDVINFSRALKYAMIF